MPMILYDHKENNWLQIKEKRPEKLNMYMYWSQFERVKLKDKLKGILFCLLWHSLLGFQNVVILRDECIFW